MLTRTITGNRDTSMGKCGGENLHDLVIAFRATVAIVGEGYPVARKRFPGMDHGSTRNRCGNVGMYGLDDINSIALICLPSPNIMARATARIRSVAGKLIRVLIARYTNRPRHALDHLAHRLLR